MCITRDEPLTKHLGILNIKFSECLFILCFICSADDLCSSHFPHTHTFLYIRSANYLCASHFPHTHILLDIRSADYTCPSHFPTHAHLAGGGSPDAQVRGHIAPDAAAVPGRAHRQGGAHGRERRRGDEHNQYLRGARCTAAVYRRHAQVVPGTWLEDNYALPRS